MSTETFDDPLDELAAQIGVFEMMLSADGDEVEQYATRYHLLRTKLWRAYAVMARSFDLAGSDEQARMDALLQFLRDTQELLNA